MSLLYCQYIDDIIMIWKGNCGSLTNFLHNINKQQQTIKPDFGISKETVSFLDTKAYIDKDQNI